MPLSSCTRRRCLRRVAACAATLLAGLAFTPAHAFENGVQGAVVDATIGTGPVGDQLLGEVGGQSSGLATLSDHTYLVLWEGLLAAKGGVLAAAHPYTPLFGGHLLASFEGGRRFRPEQEGSLYLGLRLGGDLQVLAPTTAGLDQLSSVNNIAGVGGVNVSGAARVVFGWSRLSEAHSLLAGLFAEEWARSPETNLSGEAFTRLGLTGRFDLPRCLTLSAEVSYGRTPATTDTALDYREYHSLLSADLLARKIFANGMWLGLLAGYSLEQATTTWAHGLTYGTSHAPNVTATVSFGLPLGNQGLP